MIARWWIAVAMEWAKWRRQRLPWAGLILAVLVAVGGAVGTMTADRATIRRDYARGGWQSYVKPNGFEAWAKGSSYGTQIVALVALILGAMSISGESSMGTLRLVAVRPIRRGEWYWGKATALALFVMLATLMTQVSAGIVVRMRLRIPTGPPAVPFGPGVEVSGQPGEEEETEFASVGELTEQALLASLAEIAPLLALVGVALACSACFDNPGLSMAVAFGGYVLAGLLTSASIIPSVVPWIATTYLGSSFDTLSNLARHISTETPLGPERLVWSIGVPLGTGLVGGVLGWIVFRRKDILT